MRWRERERERESRVGSQELASEDCWRGSDLLHWRLSSAPLFLFACLRQSQSVSLTLPGREEEEQRREGWREG
jgi:hypothetical protein